MACPGRRAPPSMSSLSRVFLLPRQVEQPAEVGADDLVLRASSGRRSAGAAISRSATSLAVLRHSRLASAAVRSARRLRSPGVCSPSSSWRIAFICWRRYCSLLAVLDLRRARAGARPASIEQRRSSSSSASAMSSNRVVDLGARPRPSRLIAQRQVQVRRDEVDELRAGPFGRSCAGCPRGRPDSCRRAGCIRRRGPGSR